MPDLRIRNVSVIPMDVPGVRTAQTVVIRDSVITYVGPDSLAPSPDGARVLDGSGTYLLPGFADMHLHLYRPATLDLLLANGITAARDMNGYAVFLFWRAQIRSGYRSGPRLLLATRILEGTPPATYADVVVTKDRIIVDDSAAAAKAVRAQLAQGFDLVKVYNNLNADAYRGIVAEARRLGKPVVGHVPFAVGLDGVLAAGQSTIEHLRGYVFKAVPPNAPEQPDIDFRSRLRAWRFADTTRLRAQARRTAQLPVWNVPTLATHLDLLPAARVHELTDRPGWKLCMRGARSDPVATRMKIPYYAVMSDSDFAAVQEGLRKQKELVRMLHEEGAKLLVGTDRLPWGFSFHWEMEEMVDAGLPPWSVLRAATLGAAEYLGQADRYGSVTAGKQADFVLLSANPLDDIRNTQRITAVYTRGRLLEEPELSAVRAAACDSLQAPG